MNKARPTGESITRGANTAMPNEKHQVNVKKNPLKPLADTPSAMVDSP